MGVLYIDKPKGITSFDVCFKLRKILNTKKIGHTGTLDPNATGVMIVLYNNATKANQFLVSDTKEYIGTCLLGIETDSLDIDGKIVKEEKLKMPTQEELTDVFKTFIGHYKQTPPLTSAIRVNGKRLYEYQRENIEVKVEARDVQIYELELLEIKENLFTFRCLVSSGTYIRSLLKDILDKMSLFGCLSDLRRTKINDVDISDCDTLDNVLNGKYKEHSLFDILSRRYEVYKIDNPKSIMDGKRIQIDSNADKVLVCDSNNTCLAIYQKDKDDYSCVRGLL